MALNEIGTTASFLVNVGETIDVPIYLIQTNGEDRLNTQGLYSAGVTLNYAYDSGSGNASSGNASIDRFDIDTQWDSQTINYTHVENALQYGLMEAGVNGPNNITPIIPSVGSNYVRLGSVTLLAGVEGNVTQLVLSNDQNLATTNLLYNNQFGVPLDGQIIFVGAKLLTIAAVPEPSSFLAVGVAVSMLCWVRIRTRPLGDRQAAIG